MDKDTNNTLPVLAGIKEEIDGETIEISLCEVLDPKKSQEIIDIEAKQDEINAELAASKKKSDRLTSHVDKIDVAVAASSGFIAGVIDVIFSTNKGLLAAQKWGAEDCSKFVLAFAKRNGYHGTELKGAISKLQNVYKANYDAAAPSLGNGVSHHLKDFAHHPSALGLAVSVMAQFSGKTLGVTDNGIGIVECGNANLKGGTFFEKIYYAVTNWSGHLVSDMAGSADAVGKGNMGAGIPGPIMSMLQESSGISSKLFKDNKFQEALDKAFNGDYGVKYDMRTEIGLAKVSSITLAINDAVVRGFYFVRHLYKEIKDKKISSIRELKKIDWPNVIPFRNRTVTQMLTVSLGVFMTIDTAKAAVVAASKCGGNGYAFLANFAININYVGLAKTVIAVGSDAFMGFKLDNERNKELKALSEYLELENAKISYKQADVYVAAANAEEAVDKTYELMCNQIPSLEESYAEIANNVESIKSDIDTISDKDKSLADDMKDILRWG